MSRKGNSYDNSAMAEYLLNLERLASLFEDLEERLDELYQKTRCKEVIMVLKPPANRSRRFKRYGALFYVIKGCFQLNAKATATNGTILGIIRTYMHNAIS